MNEGFTGNDNKIENNYGETSLSDFELGIEKHVLDTTLSKRIKIYKALKIPDNDKEWIEENLYNLVKGQKINFTFNGDKPEKELANIKKAFDKISSEILKSRNWNIPSIHSIENGPNFENIENIEVIVHPLYGILVGEQWDKKIWESSNRNIEEYIENILTKYAIEVNRELEKNPKYISSTYIFVMEIVQELEAMKEGVPKGTIRIYNMPRKSFLTKEKQKVLNQLLKKYSGKNTFTINSYSDSTGRLDLKDIHFFSKNLNYGTKIEIQGGYLGGCLDAAYFSFEKGVKKDRKDLNLEVDFDPSTGFSGPNNNNLRNNNALLNAPLLVKSNKLETTDDVINWVNNNFLFNNFWKSISEPNHKKNLKSYLVNGGEDF